MSPDDPRHGTNRGYRRHVYEGERACDACRAAHSRWEKGRQHDAHAGRLRIMPSVGAQRRIHALQWLGWSGKQIAAAAGLASDRQMQYLLENDSCHRNTWLAVARAYDTLSMSLPPEETGKDRWRASRVRGHARRMGWAPPLAWDNIDDPTEQPKGHGVSMTRRNPDEFDSAVVERLLLGERIDSTRAEKDEVMRRWLADGRAEFTLCRIHGWQEGRYGRTGAQVAS